MIILKSFIIKYSLHTNRYYRLWIYTCNAVLLMAVIVFCGVAGKVLLADYKRLLISGLNLSQPSFIYAYLALLVQSGENCDLKQNKSVLTISVFRFFTICRVSWCLKTFRETTKRLLDAFTGVVDWRRSARHFLDVQVRQNHAGLAANIEVRRIKNFI